MLKEGGGRFPNRNSDLRMRYSVGCERPGEAMTWTVVFNLIHDATKALASIMKFFRLKEEASLKRSVSSTIRAFCKVPLADR